MSKPSQYACVRVPDLIALFVSDCFHHRQGGDMLHVGYALAQSRGQTYTHMEGEHGTACRAEPRILTTPCTTGGVEGITIANLF